MGLKHGYGVYTYKSGAKYDGNWLNNKRNGLGVYSFANGNTYEGTWKDN